MGRYLIKTDGGYGDMDAVIGKTLNGEKVSEDSDLIDILGSDLIEAGATSNDNDPWILGNKYSFWNETEVEEVK